MTSRLKYPLSIFIVWHPKFAEGKTIANKLYSLFCRDIDQPLTRGLGIPVYFRSVTHSDQPIPINTSVSERCAIVLLIDKYYFTDYNYRDYTSSLSSIVNESTRLFPVQLCEQACDIGCNINSYQFIRAYNGDLSHGRFFIPSWRKIKTELLHDIARLLMGFQPTWLDKRGDEIPSAIMIFLSHAKKDGLEMAKRFKAFVDAELKLNVFFDAVDIADGYEFESQIEANIKKSALVVFHTDEYSAREWCRIEVLIAKRNKCPIVVVHDLEKGEKRAFPYLGNTPTITIRDSEEDSFYEIVNITLYQVINNLYQRELLELFCQLFPIVNTEYITLSSPPELFNYIDIYKKKKESKSNSIVVLYPEPPLGAEELKILNELDNNIRFTTPILLPTL